MESNNHTNQTKSTQAYRRRQKKRLEANLINPEIVSSSSSNDTANKTLIDNISNEALINLETQERLTNLNNGPQGPWSAFTRAISDSFKRTPVGQFAQHASRWQQERREQRRKRLLKQKIADTTTDLVVTGGVGACYYFYKSCTLLTTPMIFIINTIWSIFRINKHALIIIGHQQLGRKGPHYVGIMVQANYSAIPAVILTIISYVVAWRFSRFVLRRMKQVTNTII